jgi:hypothetical protein
MMVSRMENVTSLQGPVEKIDGKLVLLIPLSAGGDQFIECCKGISELHGEYLKITIPEWLSGVLRIEDGSVVSVDNSDGKFNIHAVDPRPIQ